MGRSIAQRLAAVRSTRTQEVGLVSGADLDAQVQLMMEALGAPEKPMGYTWATAEGQTRLVARAPQPAVPPTNTCPACQAWAGHMVAAVNASDGGPLRGLPAAPPCWGTHKVVA